MNYKELTAPCGIDCFNCELFANNITEKMQKRIAPFLKKEPENVKCQGCRISGCLTLPGECETKKCVEAKGLAFCNECNGFPCEKLQPCSDQAQKLPHNYKVFNLCRIKSIGIDAWAKEAKQIRKKYYNGKMAIGLGPLLEDTK